MRGTSTPFPDALSDIKTDRLLEVYQVGPGRLLQAVTDLDPDQRLARPRGPATWSAQEIVLHTADSETVGAVRFRIALAESGSPGPGYDQDVWTRELRYREMPPSSVEWALDLLDGLRKAVTAQLRVIRDPWQRTVIHPEYGAVTVRNLLELYADHSERHVEQLLVIRRLLGCPLHLESLLERRLY